MNIYKVNEKLQIFCLIFQFLKGFIKVWHLSKSFDHFLLILQNRSQILENLEGSIGSS